MKAILVIDMPDSCIECQLMTFELTGYYGTCLASDDEHDIHAESEWEQNKRWSGCPLKPMPSHRKSMVEWVDANVKTHDLTEYDKGWNDCVEFLEGSEYD